MVELKDGTVINFKLTLRELVLAKHFIGLLDSLPMEIMSNNSHNTFGKMIVTNDSTYKISVPVKTDCSFRIKYNEADSSKFSVIPTIDSVTNQLVFSIKKDVCNTLLTLIWDCDDDCSPEYSEKLFIDINGADCDCASLPDSLENAEIKIGIFVEHHYSNECDFTFEAPPGYKIATIVNLSDFRNCDTSITDSSFSFTFGCMGGGIGGGVPDYSGSAYSKTLKILVKHKETGEICDTLTKVFTCSCPGVGPPAEPIYKDIYLMGNFVNVSFVIPKGYTPFVPLKFHLKDNTGNSLKPLYTVNHSGQFVGQFSFNMLQYPNGIYYIVVEDNDQILGGKPFVFVK